MSFANQGVFCTNCVCVVILGVEQAEAAVYLRKGQQCHHFSKTFCSGLAHCQLRITHATHEGNHQQQKIWHNPSAQALCQPADKHDCALLGQCRMLKRWHHMPADDNKAGFAQQWGSGACWHGRSDWLC